MYWVQRNHLIDVRSLHCCLCLLQDACVHARHKTGALKEQYSSPCRGNRRSDIAGSIFFDEQGTAPGGGMNCGSLGVAVRTYLTSCIMLFVPFSRCGFAATGFSPAFSWLLSASFMNQGALLIRFGLPLTYSARNWLYAPFCKMPDCTISPVAPAHGEQNTYCAVGEAKRYCCRHLCE